MRDHLQQVINELGLEKKVFLCGHTNSLFEELQNCHIFAFPSLFEGWGHSLTEAMARALPAVGFDDASGINSLIQHEKTGFLADGRNRIESMAYYLSILMDDPDLRLSMGRAGTEFVKAFAPQTVYDMWEDALKESANRFQQKRNDENQSV